MKTKEIEAAVLGAILIDKNAINEILSVFNTELFAESKNATVAEAILELVSEKKPIDLLTVSNEIRQKGKLEKIGGAYYISTLTNSIGTSANIEFHTRILQQEALRRNIVRISSDAMTNASQDDADPFDVMAAMQEKLDASLKTLVKYDVKTVGKIHDKYIEQAIRVAKMGIRSGVPTGLRAMDAATNGWQKTDLIVLAGRPGSGKTSTAIKFLISPAIQNKIPTALFSLEMSSMQIVARIQSQLAQMDSSRVAKMQLSELDIMNLATASKALKKAPIFIDDTPAISLMELKGKARKLVRDEGVQLIIVDYLQLMQSGTKSTNENDEVSKISKGLKNLAKELDIPVIALSQLNRSVETRGGDKRPIMSDLRSSGQIEQDADMIVFCYRPEYYQFPTATVNGQEVPSKGIMFLDIAKHRNGSLEDVVVWFEAQFAEVKNYDIYASNSNQNYTFVQSENNTLRPNNDFEKSDQVPF